jgi:hypothetical protein
VTRERRERAAAGRRYSTLDGGDPLEAWTREAAEFIERTPGFGRATVLEPNVPRRRRVVARTGQHAGTAGARTHTIDAGDVAVCSDVDEREQAPSESRRHLRTRGRDRRGGCPTNCVWARGDVG